MNDTRLHAYAVLTQCIENQVSVVSLVMTCNENNMDEGKFNDLLYISKKKMDLCLHQANDDISHTVAWSSAAWIYGSI